MAGHKDLIDAIVQLATPTYNLQPFMAEVIADSYDSTNQTVDVTPIDGSADLQGVLLNANSLNGFLLVPKDGSVVAVTMTSNTTGFVSMVSEVDEIYLNGDNEGGIVKATDLTTKLNNLENKMNVVLGFLAGLGAVPPLTTPLVPTVSTEIENLKIQHGSS